MKTGRQAEHPTAQLLQMNNYVKCRVAKVATQIYTGAKGREVSQMVTKGKRIKFYSAEWHWWRPRTIYLKIRGDHQSRRKFFSLIWHLPGRNMKT